MTNTKNFYCSQKATEFLFKKIIKNHTFLTWGGGIVDAIIFWDYKRKWWTFMITAKLNINGVGEWTSASTSNQCVTCADAHINIPYGIISYKYWKPEEEIYQEEFTGEDEPYSEEYYILRSIKKHYKKQILRKKIALEDIMLSSFRGYDYIFPFESKGMNERIIRLF